MIASGEKMEEYRELSPHWFSRLTKKGVLMKYDIVRLKNGYSKTSPTIDVEFKGLRIGTGKVKWGAVARKKYFVIKVGKLLNQ